MAPSCATKPSGRNDKTPGPKSCHDQTWSPLRTLDSDPPLQPIPSLSFIPRQIWARRQGFSGAAVPVNLARHKHGRRQDHKKHQRTQNQGIVFREE